MGRKIGGPQMPYMGVLSYSDRQAQGDLKCHIWGCCHIVTGRLHESQKRPLCGP